jgi:hypothetical protein
MPADVRNVRVVGIPVAAVLALFAAAAAITPIALRRHTPPAPDVFKGSTSVYVVPFSGGAPRQIFRLHGQWAFPVVTADGKALIMEKPLPLAATELWRVPLDGGPRRRLATIPVFEQLAWSADRTSFATLDSGRFVRHRVDGSRAHAFAPGARNAMPSWNGDFVADELQTRPASTGWRLDLHVRHMDGRSAWSVRMPFPGAALAVAADGRSVAVARMHFLELVTPRGRTRLATDTASVAPLWTHDGRSLVYFDLKGRLVVRNVTTGAHRALVPSGRYMMETLSPDGKTVYLLRLNQPVSIPK